MKYINEHTGYDYYICGDGFYELDSYMEEIQKMYNIQDLENMFDEIIIHDSVINR